MVRTPLALLAALPLASATLYGFAILKVNQKHDFVSIANIDTQHGTVVYTPNTTKTFPSDSYCNVGFFAGASSGPVYYVPAYELTDRGYQTIITMDAASGAVLSNVSMSLPYSLPATAFDPTSGQLIALASPASGGVDIISIDPVTGKVSVLQAQIGIPDMQLCEALYAPPSAGHAQGLFYYLWQPLNVSATEVLVTYDIAARKAISSVSYVGGLNGLSLWTPPGAATQQVLATSYYEGRPMDLITLDPASGKYIVLASLPDQGYVPYQGAQTYDPSSGTVYAIMGYNNPSNSSYYPVLVEFDTKASPVSVVEHWLDEGNATGASIWSLDWA